MEKDQVDSMMGVVLRDQDYKNYQSLFVVEQEKRSEPTLDELLKDVTDNSQRNYITRLFHEKKESDETIKELKKLKRKTRKPSRFARIRKQPVEEDEVSRQTIAPVTGVKQTTLERLSGGLKGAGNLGRSVGYSKKKKNAQKSDEDKVVFQDDKPKILEPIVEEVENESNEGLVEEDVDPRHKNPVEDTNFIPDRPNRPQMGPRADTEVVSRAEREPNSEAHLNGVHQDRICDPDEHQSRLEPPSQTLSSRNFAGNLRSSPPRDTSRSASRGNNAKAFETIRRKRAPVNQQFPNTHSNGNNQQDVAAFADRIMVVDQNYVPDEHQSPLELPSKLQWIPQRDNSRSASRGNSANAIETILEKTAPAIQQITNLAQSLRALAVTAAAPTDTVSVSSVETVPTSNVNKETDELEAIMGDFLCGAVVRNP
jgi:hypothetical protein